MSRTKFSLIKNLVQYFEFQERKDELPSYVETSLEDDIRLMEWVNDSIPEEVKEEMRLDHLMGDK